MSHDEAAVAMPGGLSGVQRQHRPRRRNLREIRLLSDRLLRWGVQRPVARPELRGLRNNCHALGKTCCGGQCADLATDVSNCGSCGTCKAAPPPNESVASVTGTCVYDCAAGAILCNGTCTPVNRDPENWCLRQRLWRINAVL